MYQNLKNTTSINPPRYTSNTGRLRIKDEGYTSRNTLFFRIVEIHTKNCPTQNNIFRSFPRGTTTITFGGKSSCLWTILNYYNIISPNNIELHDLSTNSSQVTVVSGTDKKYQLFSFNKDDASTWNDVSLRPLYSSLIIEDEGYVTVTLSEYIRKFI